jgi:hypothetical protein
LKTIAEMSPPPKSGGQRSDNLQRKRKRTTISVAILICSSYKNALEEKKGPHMKEKKKIWNLNAKEGASWYCKLRNSSDVRNMIQCMKCRAWVHVPLYQG